MPKKRRGKPRRKAPDDYFASGPFEFARFGKTVVYRNNANPVQFAAMQAKMAEHYPAVVAKINALVEAIAARVVRFAPDRLLQRAWWEFAAVSIKLGGRDIEDLDQVTALRMIDYLQSVIASVAPEASQSAEASDGDWAALRKDVSDLFLCLTSEYQSCLTAKLRTLDPNLDMELEEFRFRVETVWMNVRGKRYQTHERQALLDVLTPHSDVLMKHFGIDAAILAEELAKILAKLSHGLGDTLQEMDELRKMSLERMTALAEEPDIGDVDSLRDRVFADPALAAMRDKVSGEMFGLDIFDVEKVTSLPKALLDELAWEPGQDKEFFAPGEFCGWPLRVWPIMKRPFIRLDGRILCFEMFALFDNFYRVLQRVILRLEPSYKGEWADRQKAVSESLPLVYFQRLLPGARVFKSIYYRWKSGDGSMQWHEADGLVIYEDHLFVIEVKAGAFTWTSPATDLPAHLTSLRNLVLNPASQANRFIDYFESEPEISIADEGHDEIAALRRSDFRHVTPCAVTLDAFTELAARSNHLKKVGVDVGRRPMWTLSIDDLRVYADLFDNPLIFLHFVEQRMISTGSQHVDLNDEIDHLGLYLSENNYTQYAKKLVGANPGRLQLTGYRSVIDKFYDAIVRGESPSVPSQSVPSRLNEILRFLQKSTMPRRAEVASFLLDASGKFRADLSAAIGRQLCEAAKLHRIRPFSTYGEVKLSLFTWSPDAPRIDGFAEEHTQIVMAAGSENSRTALELEYGPDGLLSNVHWRRIGLEGLTQGELKHLMTAADSLRRIRMETARGQRKIGANNLCPCGSGKKYKRCHRP